MPEEIAKTPIPAAVPETSAEVTFTQAEVDAMIGKRLAKAMKGMPGEEELAAFRAWKESQQTETQRWDELTRERDEHKAALIQAQTQLEQYERERLLLSKGVSAEDADYYAFKIGRLVSDDVSFEKAAERFLKEHPPATTKVDFGAPLGASPKQQTPNETMNSLIRGART